MKKLDVLNVKAEKVSDISLNDSIWGAQVNEDAIKKMIRLQLAATRQGTQKTKSRSEVSGGGRKPWRQKGTGRARQGSIRAPQWIKGGIALGPKPRSYKYRVNKKERQLAIRSILSSKVIDKDLIVVDKFDFKEIKTKQMADAMKNLKVTEKALVVLPASDEKVQKSARNLENVGTSSVGTINVFDLLNAKKIVLTVDTIKKLEEVYA